MPEKKTCAEACYETYVRIRVEQGAQVHGPLAFSPWEQLSMEEKGVWQVAGKAAIDHFMEQQK